MKKMASRVVAMALMAGISVGASAGYTSKTAVRYSEPETATDDTVLTINGESIGSQEYASYMLYNMRYYEDMYMNFGMTDIWDDPESAAMLGASMPDAAKEQATYSHVVLQKMEENNLKLSYQQQKDIANMRSQAIESAGGEDAYLNWIGQYGFDDAGYSNFMYVSQCYKALEDYYYGENGADAPTEDELLQEYHDNYIMAKHILIQTVDGSTGEQVRTDEEAHEEAQAILERIQAGEDFDELMNQYTEDPGIKTYPDGYIFTEGTMVEPFYEGAKELEEGEISDLVESEFGYHIILRMPLDDSRLEDYRSEICEKLGKSMENLLNEWLEEADVQTTELYDKITYVNAHNYSNVGSLAIQPSGGHSSDTEASDDEEYDETDPAVIEPEDSDSPETDPESEDSDDLKAVG